MALVANAEPGTHVIIGNEVFNFADGDRQVTQAEADELKAVLGSKVKFEKRSTSQSAPQSAPSKEES